MSEMRAFVSGGLAVPAGVLAGVGCRMEDGVFAWEALRSGLVLVVAETAQHPQRSADDRRYSRARILTVGSPGQIARTP